MTGARPDARTLAIDLGSRRIGLALCDSAGSMAFPHGVIERGGDPRAERAEIVRAAREAGVSTVVVGLPLSLDGTEGVSARLAREEAAQLAEPLAPIRVVLFDERLTTVSAHAALGAAGRSSRSARRVVDAAAATVLLQAWLDAGRPA